MLGDCDEENSERQYGSDTYEALHSTRVSISAAVTGEEDYYFRYLIVRSPKGNYYFWPAGFGLDGSLEEFEAARHHMNRVCIDRTVEIFVAKVGLGTVGNIRERLSKGTTGGSDLDGIPGGID